MWKITFFFTQFNRSWTETYYAPLSTSYSALLSQAVQVAQLRAAINGPQTFITTIRFVNTTLPRLSTFANGAGNGWQGTFVWNPATDPDQDAAPEWVALQVKFFGVANHSCRRYLSGLPEGAFSSKFGSRNVGVLGLVNNAIASYVAALGSYGWSFRFTNQANKQLVTALVTSAQFPGEVGVSFNQQMVAPVAGATIYMLLRGFRKVNYRQFGLGGVYSVDPGSPGITASVAPFTYYLQNTSNVSLTNIASKGYGVQLAYGFDAFSSTGGPNQLGYTILSANHRKRGVSALALRGRSRSKP